MLQNFKFKWIRKDKYIFSPTEKCDRLGELVINFCKRNIDFPDCFYHYQKGGHVVALHSHLKNKFFFKIDLQRFFYSISRNRVAAALRDAGFKWPRTFAKWSTVKNPYEDGPGYVLPIGFKQSPALASLVLMKSPLMKMVEEATKKGAFVSIYLDDFICSANDLDMLNELYRSFLNACAEANLTANPAKLETPKKEIVVFNCTLRYGFSEVTPDRINQFFQGARTPKSVESFNAYCNKVAEANEG